MKTNILGGFSQKYFGICMLNKNNEKLPRRSCNGCRSYTSDAIWRVKTGVDKEALYDIDHHRCGVSYSKKDKQTILNNLVKLNELEVQYGLEPTTIEFSENETIYVAKGDKLFLSEYWKSSVYTFLLKRLCGNYEEEYNQLIEKNKDLLFTLIANEDNGEILQPSEMEGHWYGGFVSFLSYTPQFKNRHFHGVYEQLVQERIKNAA